MSYLLEDEDEDSLVPLYEGKRYGELFHFLFDLQVRFSLLEKMYESDSEKVMYATFRLKGEVGQRWSQYVLTKEERIKQGIPAVTFEEMKQWLEADIKGNVDMMVRAYQTMDNLRQGPDETFEAFLQKFEQAAIDIPDELPEKLRVARLLAKLTPNFREKFYERIPQTFEELRQRGYLQDDLNHRLPPPAHHPRRKGRSRRRGRSDNQTGNAGT
ncbi:hypothetical protein GGR54DRAFT_619160 [Hypoxylon sp. NC1633]|nr:hypothetical protein GGR54DRAFT_619160 [Hypoxylon sp. NC1633]